MLASLFPDDGGDGPRLGDPLAGSASRLSHALKHMETNLAAGRLPKLVGGGPGVFVHPGLTAQEAAGARSETGLKSLYRQGRGAERFLAAIAAAGAEPPPGPAAHAVPPPPPLDLPRRSVQAGSRAEVIALERDLRGAAQALEQYRGHIAEVFDRTAAAVERLSAAGLPEAGRSCSSCRWPPLGKTGGGRRTESDFGWLPFVGEDDGGLAPLPA